MKIYHGSKQRIEKPTTKGSRLDNDYGPAFYLTLDLESAHEWASRNNSIGYVNVYEFDITNLEVLDLTDKTKYSVLNWIAILLHFRSLDPGFIKAFSNRLNKLEERFYIDVNKYDVIKGYRADDAYFRFPLDFVRGNLTLEQLEESFNLGNLGIQYALISDKAISRLKYKESILSSEKYINRYFESVRTATKRFDELDKDKEGIRIRDILENKEGK